MGKVIDNQDVPTDTQALTFDSSSDEWKAEDGGGGVNNAIINGCLFDTFAQATEFYAFGTNVNMSATESIHQEAMPFAGTVKNVSLAVSNNTQDGDISQVLRKNGVDTALTLLVLAGVNGLLSTETDVAFDQFDLYNMKIINVDSTTGVGRINGMSLGVLIT